MSSEESPEWELGELKAYGLLSHADIHYHRATDSQKGGHMDSNYDRQLALISFDNAIEISMDAYLASHLDLLDDLKNIRHPKRHGKYKCRLSVILKKIKEHTPSIPCCTLYKQIAKYHKARNAHYHESVPEKQDNQFLDNQPLMECRNLAIWFVQTLFPEHDVKNSLGEDNR